MIRIVNLKKNQLIKVISFSLAITLLTSCGFHLRGQGEDSRLSLHDGIEVYLAVTSDDKMLRRQLTNDLQASGILVVSEPEQSSKHLIVLNSSVIKRAIGVDSNGRNNEFELNQNVEFLVNSYLEKNTTGSIEQIASDENVETIHVEARRSFYLDNIDLIGKRAEEKGLLESIRQEVSRKIISRFVVAIDNQYRQKLPQ